MKKTYPVYLGAAVLPVSVNENGAVALQIIRLMDVHI